MSLKRIITLPDPILRKKSLSVNNVDKEIKNLMNDMLETMYAAPGIGLAAVQPAVAATGAYDPTNLTQLGRPKGFKQNTPRSDDPTESETEEGKFIPIDRNTGRPHNCQKIKYKNKI